MPTEAQNLVIRRRIGVALLGHAYLMAAYRESPAASAMHTVFVQWYLANRGLFGVADATLQSLERSGGLPRLTSQTGYNAASGYALGVALADVAPAMLPVWRTQPPATQAALPDWLERSGYLAASDTFSAFNGFDSRLRVSLDPVRMPAVAQQLVAGYIETGSMGQVPDQPVPGFTPGDIRAMEYEGSPEGPKGSGATAAQSTSTSSGSSMTTQQASMPTFFRQTDSAKMALGIGGLVLAGTGLYYFIQSQVKR